MKRASKMLILLVVAVFMLNILCGCSGVFTKNTDKYRNTEAIKVGNEVITIGDLIDTYNSYYQSYYQTYSQYGYSLSSETVLNAAISALYTQYMKIDAYKSNHQPENADVLNLKDSGYLSSDEVSYAVKYVKYLLFTTLDSLVEDYAAADGFELGDEEEEDTSRDFYEYDDLQKGQTYSEYIYLQNFENEDMEEYLTNYYPLLAIDNLSIDSYVLSADSTEATAKVDALNARLDEDAEEKITAAQLVDWQSKALQIYKKNVKYTYEYELETLVKNQAEDMVQSIIVLKYDYENYKAIDSDDNLSNVIAKLETEYNALKNNQTAKFEINNDFVDYIEDLSDDSYIFNVPEEYEYIFVKNILIPFNDSQTAILANLEDQLGTTDNELYIQMRNELAAQVIADDFNSEQDSDGNYTVTAENMFKLDDNGNVVINYGSDAQGVLKNYLNEDGTVTAMDGKSLDETIEALMAEYNTDTAQHSAVYDYVVRVGDNIPDTYTSSWVTEFVDAATAAYEQAEASGAEGGTYAIAISSYGVHIVYYSAKVKAQQLSFSKDTIFDSTTVEYRMFKSYFETEESLITEQALEDLQKEYYVQKDSDGNVTSEGKIVKLKGFDAFLKENGFTFDFDESILFDDDD